MDIIMKKTSIISALALVCLTVLGLSGCKHEELDTEQFSDSQVKMLGFAPNPVARGGALRIVGSNLQKVQQVEIPGVEPITEIEVISEGKVSEIRVIVPVNGPEVGPVSIVAGDTRLTSMTDLEYSEPIVFDGFSPESAMPGDVITVKGDYMNNIRQVIFEGGEAVTEFESQSRYELKVKVPSSATTGKIILGDVDENNNPDGKVSNLFYSEKDLSIGEPTVKTAALGVVKAGASVTATGAYLNMIESVNFGGVDAEFQAAEDGRSLTAVLPATAVDGDLVLVSYAGREFKAGAYTTLVPSELVIAADSRYKAGLGVKITGKDIDLVTAGSLAGTDLALTVSDKSITFTIPAEARDGAVTLTLANGKTVDTDAIELVKPVIKSVSPLELFAGDGNITVTGDDLDLVVAAQLGGRDIEIKKDEAAKAAEVKSLELVTTLTSVSGKVALVLANGITVESAEEVNVKYHSLVIVSEMPSGQHIGEEVVLKGSNFDLVENIFIGDEKVTKYSLRTAEEVRFLMPWAKAGSYQMSFHLFNGDVETVATPIEVLLERAFNVVFEGEAVVNWNNAVTIPFSSLAKNMTVIVEYAATPADYHMLRIINSDWSFNPDGNDTYNKSFDDDGVWSIPVTAELYGSLAGKDMSLTGAGCNINKVTLISEIPQETTIFEGPVSLSWGDDGRFGLATSYFENLSAGSKMIIYFTQTEEWGQVQINDAAWKDNTFSFPELGGAYLNTDNVGGKNVTSMELTLTQEILDHIKEVSGDYFGVNVKYKGDGRCAVVIQGSAWIIEKITVK